MVFVARVGIRQHYIFDDASAVDKPPAHRTGLWAALRVRDLPTAPRLGAFGLTR